MPLRHSSFFGLFLFACLLGTRAAYGADTPIQQTSQGYQITYPKYSALVSNDGCLDSLRVGGSEFLDANVGFRHGSYFYQNGPLKTPNVRVSGPNEIVARGDKAAITYTFTPEGMTWTTENETDQGMVFFLILPPQAGGAIDPNGQIVRTPVAQNEPEVSFVRDHNTLHVRGSDKLWGPFEGDTQVWEQDIAPHAQRTITFDFGTAAEAQVTQIDRLRMPQVVPVSDVTLLSPRDYQVFQRQT